MSRSETPPDEGIDWQQVRARLAAAAAKTEQAGLLTPERARTVMAERARLLARPLAAAAQAVAALEVIVFTLAGERYAVETTYVREVVRLAEVTPLPGVPAFLAGVTNRRGQVLALIDLPAFFGIAAPAPGER